MSGTTVIFFMGTLAAALSLPQSIVPLQQNDDLQIITRQEWDARPPKSLEILNTPVSLVVIHHSYEPAACFNIEECSKAMRFMQDYHQIYQDWEDIGYNFAVGSDGLVYEGRGWQTIGAHAAGYNSISIGIVLIGDWVSNIPPANQIETVKKLISLGVELGHISAEYAVIGHRQVRSTECPGQALFDEISTWDQFETNYGL